MSMQLMHSQASHGAVAQQVQLSLQSGTTKASGSRAAGVVTNRVNRPWSNTLHARMSMHHGLANATAEFAASRPCQGRGNSATNPGRLVPSRQLRVSGRGPVVTCAAAGAAAATAQLGTTAASQAVALVSSLASQGALVLRACVQTGVLAAACGTAVKLVFICGGVGALIQYGRLPRNTATVLSQVSYQLFIPAMLFMKVGLTLVQQPDMAMVTGISLVAVFQICVGALIGRALAPLVDGQYSTQRRIFGWHPLRPAQSASAIASMTAVATGVPMASQALLPRTGAPPQGLRQFVSVASAFGNSFTLPALFFSSLLPPALADQAIGVTALFTLAWSPLLWTYGLNIVNAPPQEPPSTPANTAEDHFQTKPAKPRFTRAALRAWAASTWFHWALRARNVVNPPLVAILAGIAVALSPLGGLLFLPGTEQAIATRAGLPAVLRGLLGLALCAVQVFELLATGTLPVQTLVLGASLFGSSPVAATARLPAPGLAAYLKALLLPADALEARALVVIAVSRFVFVPAATLALLKVGSCFFAIHPLVRFVLLVQSVSPSAQNLILLLNLAEKNRILAARFSGMFCRLYAYAMLPLACYITVFSLRLGLQM